MWVVRRHEKKHRAIQTGSGPYQATTKMSVSPNLQRAPTTVSIPQLYGNAVQAEATYQHTSNPHPHVHQYLNHTNHSIPSNWFMEQHPHGVNMGRKQGLPQKSVLVLIMNQLELNNYWSE